MRKNHMIMHVKDLKLSIKLYKYMKNWPNSLMRLECFTVMSKETIHQVIYSVKVFKQILYFLLRIIGILKRCSWFYW